jgi:hypothetical protein
MTSVDLHRHEVEEGWMPQVCARCGDESRCVRAKTVVWSPWWMPLVVVLTGFVIFLPFVRLLFAAALGGSETNRRVTLHLPFCGRHRNHWRWRSWPLMAVLTLSVGATAGGIVVDRVETLLEVTNKTGLLVFAIGVLGLVVGGALALTGIRVSDLAGSALTLTGVSETFCDAVAARRLQKPKPGGAAFEMSDYDDLLRRRRRERRVRKRDGSEDE